MAELMEDEDRLYLDNLEEFINDEDKIVTYKWLSRTLSVSSNQAKQMLYNYMVKQVEDKNATNISATFLIGGKCHVDGQMIQQFILTNDDNLDDTKASFDVVTSVHVYSLQKNKPKDGNAFYTVDYNINKEHKNETNRWNHIYCKQAKPFGDGGANRGQSYRQAGKENSKPIGSTGIVNGQGSSDFNSSNCAKTKSANQKAKKGQLPSMGMFAKKVERGPNAEKEELKPSESSNDKSNDMGKNQKTTKNNKQAESMLSFFGKPVAEQHATPEQNLEDTSKAKSHKKSQEIKVTIEKLGKSDDTSEKLDENKMVPTENTEMSNKRKERKKIQEHTKETKNALENKTKHLKKISKQNRRRIKNLDSSEEEDEEPIQIKITKLVSDSESNYEEDVHQKKASVQEKKSNKEESTSMKKKTNKNEKGNKDIKIDENEEKPKKNGRKRKKDMGSSNSEEVSKTPIGQEHSAGNPTKRRKRRKVMRSKTYVDDDGFMVTEKVYESESTDASDEEPLPLKLDSLPNINQAKKASPESKRKKITEVKPAKQASLMNFFKKS